MASTAIPEAVFLDAQAFENASFNFNSTQFTALKTHLQSGRLRLVRTDITAAEVKSRISKNVVAEVAAHKKFVKGARVLRSSAISEPVVTMPDEGAIIKDLLDAFDRFIDDHKAEVIDATDQDAGPVFERYFAGMPPFGAATEKKHEFPDAFVAEALKEWTEDSEQELFVVSGDDLFREACGECDEIHVKSTLVEVLDHVASDNEKVADFVRQQLEVQAQEIGKQAGDRLEELGFYLIDEWGDVEIQVTNVTLARPSEIVGIRGREANAQMGFDAKYDATLSWDDSTTGVYDNEDGRVLFMETRSATVHKTQKLVVDVHIALNGVDPDEFDVDEVDLVEPSNNIGIRVPPAYWENE